MSNETLTKDDVYPRTVWTQLRETGLLAVALPGAAVMLVGDLIGLDVLTMIGKLVVAVALLLFPLVLVMEYRADMKYDRDNPRTDEEA